MPDTEGKNSVVIVIAKGIMLPGSITVLTIEQS